jgi:hypothetical protein
VGEFDKVDEDIEFEGEVEVDEKAEEEEECGIPEERADGELVCGTSLSIFLSLSFVAPMVASKSRSSSSMDLIPALEARGGRRSSTSDWVSALFSPPLHLSFSTTIVRRSPKSWTDRKST